MARGRRLSDAGVANLRPRAARYLEPDPQMPGLYVRVSPSGAKSYVVVIRDPNGKQVWHTLGPTAWFSVDEARAKARDIIKALKSGKNPAGPETFEAVAETWFKRHVEAKGLVSAGNLRRLLDRCLMPAWRGREFASIRRSDVAKLLDEVEDSSGGPTADHCLSLIRNLANWHAARTEDYVSPIVRGMRRIDPAARARSRILKDEELRLVWLGAEDNGSFGAFLRLCLLTAQRREKVLNMRWDDISIDGTWKVPVEGREKGTGGELPLPQIAVDIIRAQPRFVDNPYVLAGQDLGAISGISKRKDQFDAKVELAPWVIHDLRRTARSLMSRAGVRPDVAERVLGHVVGGVEGIYDRHHYTQEKADALRRLAALIENIVRPSAENVVPLVAAQ
jgi:integrase